MGKKLLLLILFVFFANSVYAAPNIEISELMYDPTNVVSGTAKDSFRCVNDSSCQWIELHNKENFSVDLSSWRLKVNTKTNGNELYNFGDIAIQPDEYIVVATQLGDEDSDGFSFASLYGNKDGIWDNNTDGFRAVDSEIPFIKTPNVGPESNPSVEIRLMDEDNVETSSMVFDAHFVGPVYFVQKSNGYTMELDTQNRFMQSLSLGGSPGKKRNSPPVFSNIPNLTLSEDQVLNSRLIDFRNFVSDPDNNDNDLVFSITKFNATVSNMLTCGVIGAEDDISKTYFLNCTNLGRDLNGRIDVTVNANDGVADDNKNFFIIVNPVNDAPVINSTAVEIAVVGLDYLYDAEAMDIDGDDFTFSLVESPSGMTINSSSGKIKWTPAESQIGEHNVEISVRDITANSKSSTQEFKIDVKPIFGFSNVNVDYSGGSLTNVNESQTINRVYTASEFNITSTLINRHPAEQGIDITVEDIELRIRVVKEGDVIIDDIIDSGFLLNSLDSRELEYVFSIPRDLDEGIYRLTLEAEGDLFDVDENLRDIVVPQTRIFEISLDVQQARHDIFISGMNVNDGEMCSKESKLEVIIQNSGTRIERNLNLRVNNPQLGIDSSINIPSISPGRSNKQIINLTNTAGSHNITAILNYNNGQDTEVLENFVSCNKKGDLDWDYCVGGKDAEILASKMGLKSSDNGFESRFDIIKNNIIDLDDFYRLADIIEPNCSFLTPVETKEPPVVVKGEGFSVDLSQIKLLLQQGSSLVSRLKITNKEDNIIITRHSLEGEFLSDENKITSSFLNTMNVLSSASRELEIKTSIPEEFKPGSYSGTFKVETDKQTELIPFEVEVFPDLCSNGIKGDDILINVNEPDRNDDFKPGETINVDLNIRNRGNERDISVEGILWNIDKNKEVESIDAESLGLDRGEDEDVEFEITVPEDVENDKIVLYVKGYDEDNEENQCNAKSVGLDVKRDRKDIRITSVSAPSVLTCDSKSSIKVSARNFGKNDDKNVFFRITNPDIGISLESDKFELKRFDDKEDTITKTFSFDVSLNEVESSAFLIEVVYDDNNLANSMTKDVSVTCEKEAAQTITATTESGNNLGTEASLEEKTIESIRKEVDNSILINTAVFLAVMLGLGIVSYMLKTYIIMKK